MMNRLSRCAVKPRSFWQDKSGVAAVEFAMFAPFLMGAVLVLVGVGLAAFDEMKLTAGVRGASQYVLAGGQVEAVIDQMVIEGSGLDISADDVSYTSYCGCTSNSNTNTDVCDVLCAGDVAPRIYTVITATIPDSGYNISFLGIYDITIPDTSASAEVRTR